MELKFDDTRLFSLIEALDPKQREQALKKAMRAAGRQFRRAAVEAMRATGIARDAKVERGIRVVLPKRRIGFRVTVGTRRSYNRKAANSREKAYRRKDAVALWAEGGTVARETAGSLFGRRKSHPTGKMPQFEFMDKARQSELPGIERTVKASIMEAFEKATRSNGSAIK